MDSGVAPHLRGRRWSHIFAPSPPEPALRGPLARLACGRSRCASVCVAGLAAPNFSWHAFYFISMFGKGHGGQGRGGRGRGKSKCGTCSGCKRKKGCEGRAIAAVTPNKSELQWGLVADTEFRSPLETKTVALSVRSSFVTGSQKKAKPGEQQTHRSKDGPPVPAKAARSEDERAAQADSTPIHMYVSVILYRQIFS